LIDIFIRARAKLSVPVNSVWIGVKSLPEALHRFCAPAFFHNEGELTYDLSTRGSAILLRFRERSFAVLTHHQLGKGPHSLRAQDFTIGIDDADGKKIGLTPNAITRVKVAEQNQKNLEDLQICQYEDERNGRDLSRLFLTVDLEHTLETVPTPAVKAIFLIGFPSEFTEVNVGDWDEERGEVPMTMKLRWVKLCLQPASNRRPLDPENRIVLEPHTDAHNTLKDPDGLSGAPVFFVWLDEEKQAHLGLAGVLTNARPDRFAVYSAVHIRSALEQCVSADTRA